MKNKAIFLSLILVLGMVSSVSAASFSDNFDNLNTDGWIEYSGVDFAVDSGTDDVYLNAHGSGDQESFYWNSTGGERLNFSDGWLSAEIKNAGSQSGSPRLITRFQTSGNDFYMCRHSPSSDELQLYLRNNGGWTLLNSQAQTYSNGVYYTINVSTSGDTITCKDENNNVETSATDTTLSSGYAGFGIGTNADTGTGNNWDNATISSSEFSSTSPSSSVTVDTPSAYSPYQRNSSSPGLGWSDITVSGSYTGSPSSIEASLDGGVYRTIDSNPSGGSFSGTASFQAGQGELKVRVSNNTGVSDTVSNISVGDIHVTTGQSIMVGQANTLFDFSGSPTSYVYTTNDTWKVTDDPTTGNSATTGSIKPYLASNLTSNQSVPQIFITTSYGGAGNSFWHPEASTFDGCCNVYNRSVEQVNEATNGRMNVDSVMYYGGEDDMLANEGADSISENKEFLGYMTGNFSQDFNIQENVLIGQPGIRSGADEMNEVRQAHLEFTQESSDASLWAVGYNITTGDGVHFQTDSQVLEFKDQALRSALGHLYGFSDGVGPVLENVSTTDNQSLNLSFSESLDQSVGLSTSIFTVRDSTGSVRVSSVGYLDSDSVWVNLTSSNNDLQTVSLGKNETANGLNIPQDQQGIYSPSVYQKSISFTGSVDTTPPTTSDNWTETGFVDKAWALVEITATDDNSGVSNISYQLNGNGYQTVESSSTTVNISEFSQQQNNTLEYYAVDNEGNVESTNTEYVAIRVNPNVTFNDTDTAWRNNSDLTVKITGSAKEEQTITSVCSQTTILGNECSSGDERIFSFERYGEELLYAFTNVKISSWSDSKNGDTETQEYRLGSSEPNLVLERPVDGASNVSLDRNGDISVDYRPADYDGRSATNRFEGNTSYSLHWQSNDSVIDSYSTNWYWESNAWKIYGFENQSFTIPDLESGTEYSVYLKSEDDTGTNYDNITFTTANFTDSSVSLNSPPDGSSFLDTETVDFEYEGSFRYDGSLDLEIDDSVVKSTNVSANSSLIEMYSSSNLDVGSHSFQAVYRDSQGVIASSETRSLEIVNSSSTTAEKTILKDCASTVDTFCLENGSSPVTFENGFTPEDNTTVEWNVNATGGQGDTFTFYSFANSTGGNVGEVQASAFNVTVNDSTSSSNSDPSASFTVSPLSPEAGESVSFDGSGSSDSDGSIASYSWSFGDGDSGSGETVSHTYSSSGDYTVELQVTDDDGATDSATTTLTVESSSSGGGGGSGGDENTSDGDNTTSSTTSLDGSTAKLVTPHIGARYGGSVLAVKENNTDSVTVTVEGNEVSLFINEIFNTTHAEATIDGQTEIIREDDQIGPNGNIRIGDVLPIEPDDGLVYFAQHPTFNGSSEVPLNANYSLQEDVTINLQYREGGVGNSWQTVDTKSPGAGASGFIGDTPSISDSGIYEARVQLSNGSETVNGAPAGFYIGQVPELNVIEPDNGDTYVRKVNPEVQIPLTYKATTFNDTVFTPYYESGGEIFDTASVFDTQVSNDGIDTADILQFLNPLSFYNQISEFLTGETLFTTVPDETTITQAVNVTVSGDSGSYTAYVNATRNDSNIGFNTTSLGKTAELVIVGIDNESYQEDRVKKVESDTEDEVNTQPHINDSVDEERDFNPNSSGNETFRDPYFWPLSPSNGSIKQLLRVSEDKVDLYFDMGHNGSAQLNRTLTLKKDGKDVVSYYLVNTKTSYKISLDPADLPNGSWENRGNYTWYGEFRDRNGSIVYSTENKVNGSSTFQVKQQVLSSSLVPECFIEGKLYKCSTDTKNTSSAVIMVLLAFALVSKDWGRSMVGGYTWLAGIMALAYFNWLPTVWGMLALLLAGVMTAGWLVRQFG